MFNNFSFAKISELVDTLKEGVKVAAFHAEYSGVPMKSVFCSEYSKSIDNFTRYVDGIREIQDNSVKLTWKNRNGVHVSKITVDDCNVDEKTYTIVAELHRDGELISRETRDNVPLNQVIGNMIALGPAK